MCLYVDMYINIISNLQSGDMYMSSTAGSRKAIWRRLPQPGGKKSSERKGFLVAPTQKCHERLQKWTSKDTVRIKIKISLTTYQHRHISGVILVHPNKFTIFCTCSSDSNHMGQGVPTYVQSSGPWPLSLRSDAAVGISNHCTQKES